MLKHTQTFYLNDMVKEISQQVNLNWNGKKNNIISIFFTILHLFSSFLLIFLSETIHKERK